MTAHRIKRRTLTSLFGAALLLGGCLSEPSAPEASHTPGKEADSGAAKKTEARPSKEPDQASSHDKLAALAIQKKIVTTGGASGFDKMFGWLPGAKKNTASAPTAESPEIKPAKPEEAKNYTATHTPPVPGKGKKYKDLKESEKFALVRGMVTHPPLSNADSPELLELVGFTKTHHTDLQRLRQLQKSPDPQALEFLLQTAERDINPLAPAATYQLRDYPGSRTEKFL